MSLRAFVIPYAEKFASLAPWALPLKLILGGVLGALGGAGFLGFLSEYATYNYSIHYGFRPPLEGIPYLKATVTLGSFVLLLTGAAVFLLSLLIVRFIVWSLEISTLWPSRLLRNVNAIKTSRARGFLTVFDRLSSRPPWQVLTFAVLAGLVTSGVGYFELIFLNGLYPEKPDIDPFRGGIATGILGFVMTVAMAKRGAIWWLGGMATFGYFLVWLWVLFSPTWYASFLRTVGYGGGLPVIVEFREQAQPGQTQAISCFLLLRTTEAMLLMSTDSGTILEVPRDQVRSMSHAGGGLRQLPFKLPTMPPSE
ncbi:hypothetical protein [Hydrogenophaga sp.]|uniref:hypothetical protein n=1 Tax=Hydrogenophaga sp. TaxID=1904254 RepID=UPI00273139BA|nr:hypothetical protein [Hydrogenophaga sp.]MDP2015493.1 hypothetical protein [Hydrogenophaga sp.]